MPYHIYNGDKVVEEIINGAHIIISKYGNEELTKDMNDYKDKVIQCMHKQSRNIEIRGVLKQRINTFGGDQLECPDIRRWWSEMEIMGIAQSIPEIEQFLKEIYGNQYPAYKNKMDNYKKILNDIKYRMDIIVNNKYTVTNPEQAKFIHETERLIGKICLINDEAKKVHVILDMFTSMGDMTIPSTTLQVARSKFRKVEYEQQDRRDTNREYIEGGGT